MKSDEIQRKNPTLRIESDSATRIPIRFRRMVGSDQIRSGPVSDDIGLMNMGISDGRKDRFRFWYLFRYAFRMVPCVSGLFMREDERNRSKSPTWVFVSYNFKKLLKDNKNLVAAFFRRIIHSFNICIIKMSPFFTFSLIA
jgi:hypothetical protein